MRIPFSPLASPEAEKAWHERHGWEALYNRALAEGTAPGRGDAESFAQWLRDYYDQHLLPVFEAKQRARFAVTIKSSEIAGITVERFVPEEGVAPDRRHRMLINLHGGAFSSGRIHGGRVESIPIACGTGIEVVSIDYRMWPEASHPAAADDVIAVYRDLLTGYSPDRIGVFGCSAGAMLAAQAIARMIADDLPRPAAIAMISGTGELVSRGDSAMFWAMLNGRDPVTGQLRQRDRPYLANADPDDPSLFPMRHASLLAQFPPSLLVSGSRSYDMSSVIDAHRKLVRAGVDAALHIWEGAMHAFLFDPDLPEAQEAYAVIARFFGKHMS